MKILLSAYWCEPGRGSEWGVGWNVAREIARYHEVWVLTCLNGSNSVIEAELARNPVPNLHFVYFTLPVWANGWTWGHGAFLLHYYLWQIQAYFVASRLHNKIGFDLVQHATLVRYSSPSFLSLLPIPFIWGPVGGGESAPMAFWRDFNLQGKVYETQRDLVRRLGELDPFVHLTAQRSAVALATTQETAQRLLRLGVKDVQVFSNAGLPKEDISHLAQYALPNSNSIRFISIGRLLHWKGFHLGLRAFALARIEKSEYWLVGEGPELKRLEALARELGIIDLVRFWGALPRDETLNKLGECHVLIHPSLHESGGWVCSEMMAAGRCVICLDLGGPALQVTQETGFKIPAQNPEQAVRSLADAMIHSARDPQLRVRMGLEGQRRVNEVFNWEAKGRFLVQFHEKIFRGNKNLALHTDRSR